VAKQKFVHFVPRPKPKKRPRRHKKDLNKNEKRMAKKNRYKGQGRVWEKILLLMDYKKLPT